MLSAAAGLSTNTISIQELKAPFADRSLKTKYNDSGSARQCLSGQRITEHVITYALWVYSRETRNNRASFKGAAAPP